MAQLGNLLVTGFSRFLQKVYFADDISTDGKVDSNGLTVGDKIQLLPNQANFNVPVTVSSNFTVSGGTVTADRINSKSVYVADVLNATRYEISTIQSLGGIVDVCPSFKTSSSATVTVTSVSSSINVGYNFDGVTSVSLTGYYRVVIKDTKQITSSTICGSTWTRYSKVKITGTLAGNSCNSIDAYLLYDLNSNTAGAITLIVPKTSFSVSGAVSNMSCPDVDVILVDIYKSINGGTSKRRPVGMYLSSYNGSVGTGISIYDGNVDSPSLLLGDLSNSTLPNINNLTPQGWGLYATNAYLQGIIVSESGKIGGWNLSSTSIWNGNSTFKNAYGMYFGSSGLSITDRFYVDSLCNTVYIGVNKKDANQNTVNGAALKLTGETIDFVEQDTSVASFSKNLIALGKNSDTSIINLCNSSGIIKSANPQDSTYKRLAIESNDSVEINANRISKINVVNNTEEDGLTTIYSATIGMNASSVPWDSDYDDSVEYGSIILRSTMTFRDNSGDSKFQSMLKIHPGGFQYTDERGSIESLAGQLNLGMSTRFDAISTFNNNIIANNVIYAHKQICLANNMSIRSYDTQGNDRQVIGLNKDNHVMIGWGTYSNKDTSTTSICAGDKILFLLGKQNATWRPYYTAGDSIRFNGIKTTGYITNNKTELHFSLSLDRPVIGATKATIQTITSDGVSYMGVCIRQGGKYLYGSSATEYPQPSICNIGIMNGCLNFLMKFGNTENVVTNNDTCGIVTKFEIYLE